ncbi:hypothetical protein [Bradyrhizobium sp. OAE829]|uniref:hypothetical protein n=1 Tax=Bradyrhizobium sp. OAE829 TaxID=2663807 RepID=UPI0017891A36
MPLGLRRKTRIMEKVENSTALHARRTPCLDGAITWSGFVIGTLQAFATLSMRAGAEFEISARWIDVYSELTSEQSIAAPDRARGLYPGGVRAGMIRPSPNRQDRRGRAGFLRGFPPPVSLARYESFRRRIFPNIAPIAPATA